MLFHNFVFVGIISKAELLYKIFLSITQLTHYFSTIKHSNIISKKKQTIREIKKTFNINYLKLVLIFASTQ